MRKDSKVRSSSSMKASMLADDPIFSRKFNSSDLLRILSMKIKKALKYIRMKVGKLFIIAGFVLIGAEIYLGWQDGVWNRFPLSMLLIDTIHFMGRAM